jgi:hypothetical protein
MSRGPRLLPMPDDPVEALNVLRLAAGLEPLHSDASTEQSRVLAPATEKHRDEPYRHYERAGGSGPPYQSRPSRADSLRTSASWCTTGKAKYPELPKVSQCACFSVPRFLIQFLSAPTRARTWDLRIKRSTVLAFVVLPSC